MWLANDYEIIKQAIKQIWLNNIKDDYDNKRILNEDTLKALFYFHLRNNLKEYLNDTRVRIYTEFNLNQNKRVDLAVVKIDKEDIYGSIGIEEIIALVEFKCKILNPYRYKDGAATSAIIPFQNDLFKLKEYGKQHEHTLLYGAFISEYEYYSNFKNWIDCIAPFFDEKSLNRITELVGIRDADTGDFKTYIH